MRIEPEIRRDAPGLCEAIDRADESD